MYRVIDTIHYGEHLLERFPQDRQRGQGLLVLLDPAQVRAAPVEPGATVRIHVMDGRTVDRVVADVAVHHGVVGLFFSGATVQEIPRLSEIEVLGA